jgi:RHS repeat-associated protein
MVETKNGKECESAFYYHSNHLGSSSTITDKEGEFYQHIEYFPYGETWIDDRETDDTITHRFTGQEYDKETNLYNYNARQYDPVLGRFMSPDPAGQHLNLYMYCRNNPVMYVDPSGMYDEVKSPSWDLKGYEATRAPGGGDAPATKEEHAAFKAQYDAIRGQTEAHLQQLDETVESANTQAVAAMVVVNGAAVGTTGAVAGVGSAIASAGAKIASAGAAGWEMAKRFGPAAYNTSMQLMQSGRDMFMRASNAFSRGTSNAMLNTINNTASKLGGPQAANKVLQAIPRANSAMHAFGDGFTPTASPDYSNLIKNPKTFYYLRPNHLTPSSFQIPISNPFSYYMGYRGYTIFEEN